MTLNKNPDNFFAQIEQAAFEPSAIVPGIGFSPDKMLLGRAFAYGDTHRYRIGTNYNQLPVNRPRVEHHNTYTQDGAMAFEHGGDQAVYAPNSFGRGYADEVGEVAEGWESDGPMMRQAYTLRADDDDWTQAGTLVREVWNDEIREAFVNTVAGHLLGGVKGEVLERAFQYWKSVDADTGKRIEELVRSKTEGDAPGGQPKAAKADASSPIVEDASQASH
ncbi:MAG: catalase, partial [Marmoricola sp.]